MQIAKALQMFRPQNPAMQTPPTLSTGDFVMPTRKMPLWFGGKKFAPDDPSYLLIEHLILDRYRLPPGVSNRG